MVDCMCVCIFQVDRTVISYLVFYSGCYWIEISPSLCNEEQERVFSLSLIQIMLEKACERVRIIATTDTLNLNSLNTIYTRHGRR
jgi:hypothetical protein